MIPFDYITEWRAEAPWVDDAQVEQDLVISRALVEIFRHPVLAESVALRGGTALAKLHLRPPARYSEDIDLVQTTAEAAGPMMDALRSVLEPWLGRAKWKQGEGRITFYFRFTAESSPVPLRLKVETNTREHFAIYGLRKAPFAVSSRWFEGACDIQTYELDELLGTKLRALYQRKQSRDLFDLEIALTRLPVDPQRIVSAFLQYMEHEGHPITRAQVERNLALKMRDGAFLADLSPLLASGEAWAPVNAETLVSQRLVALLPGESWKGEEG
ncbi:MAG: nucleotidyl transferase AbiEii/AbiGii toxin family protein [Acidobacteria bacterium]|nr:nucleotidyl transferase AbiEii/AbiGii toxin family protein [Acidobacteriota bacterium]